MTRLVAFMLSALTGVLVLANPAHAVDASPTFYCQLRTPAGDTLGLTVQVVTMSGTPSLFIFSRDGKSWPGDSQTSLLATFAREGTNEFEFVLNNNIRIRMERAGQLKNITFWSFDDGKIKQPMAFGFCGNSEIVNSEVLSPSYSQPLDRSRWVEGCFATQHHADGVGMFDFRMEHGIADGGRLVVTFSNGPFSQSVTVPRELLKATPKAEHPGIFMGVGRFAATENGAGPRGMDVAYLDEGAKLMSTIVRFNTVRGSDGPAFAICSAKIQPIEKMK